MNDLYEHLKQTSVEEHFADAKAKGLKVAECWQSKYQRVIETCCNVENAMRWEFFLQDCNPWHRDIVAAAIENQFMLDVNESRLAKVPSFLKRLAAPYLVNTRPMNNWITIVQYLRPRNHNDIIAALETEDVVVMTNKVGVNGYTRNWDEPQEYINVAKCKDLQEEMITRIDSEIINGMACNAGTVMLHTDPVAAIKQMCDKITSKTQNEKPKFVVLANSVTANSFSKIIDDVSYNLEYRGFLEGCAVFGSHLLKRDVLLVSDHNYQSYVFAPHICFAPDCDDQTFSCTYAVKLLREGSKGIGRITLG